MSKRITQIFNSFQDYLNNEQETREKIRVIIKEIEKNARDILIILQDIHNAVITYHEESITIEPCAHAKELFEEVRKQYASLAALVPNDQYYRFHEQWRFVTQRLCFLVCLEMYLEVRILVDKETVADMLGVKNNREEGFHLDLEDYLLGLLQLSAELSRFAVNSVTGGEYGQAIQIAQFLNELNAGFRLLNLKNDMLRKRFDCLEYDVKRTEEVVHDLTIRDLKPGWANSLRKWVIHAICACTRIWPN